MSEAFELAKFGLQMEEFRNSDIGKYIEGCARQDVMRAQAGLLTVSPTDTTRIMELQFEARVAQRVMEWISEAVQIGRNAEAELQQQEEEASGY